ncbi:MAG: hypothetical protein J2P21_23525, partial [Chloracidobacterium sp.]|nr:hypothetical protein [Chloracidobacterium sp.]
MVRRTLTICGLLCALIIGVATVNAQSGIKGTQKNAKSAQNEADSAQKSVNFAGTWKLDKGKSQFPQQRQADFYKSMTWIVTQDDKQLTRQQQVERNDYEANGGGGGYGGGGRGGMGGGRGGIGGGGGYGGGGGIGGG